MPELKDLQLGGPHPDYRKFTNIPRDRYWFVKALPDRTIASRIKNEKTYKTIAASFNSACYNQFKESQIHCWVDYKFNPLLVVNQQPFVRYMHNHLPDTDKPDQDLYANLYHSYPNLARFLCERRSSKELAALQQLYSFDDGIKDRLHKTNFLMNDCIVFNAWIVASKDSAEDRVGTIGDFKITPPEFGNFNGMLADHDLFHWEDDAVFILKKPNHSAARTFVAGPYKMQDLIPVFEKNNIRYSEIPDMSSMEKMEKALRRTKVVANYTNPEAFDSTNSVHWNKFIKQFNEQFMRGKSYDLVDRECERTLHYMDDYINSDQIKHEQHEPE